jgi:hypothetical protein
MGLWREVCVGVIYTSEVSYIHIKGSKVRSCCLVSDHHVYLVPELLGPQGTGHETACFDCLDCLDFNASIQRLEKEDKWKNWLAESQRTDLPRRLKTARTFSGICDSGAGSSISIVLHPSRRIQRISTLISTHPHSFTSPQSSPIANEVVRTLQFRRSSSGGSSC